MKCPPHSNIVRSVFTAVVVCVHHTAKKNRLSTKRKQPTNHTFITIDIRNNSGKCSTQKLNWIVVCFCFFFISNEKFIYAPEYTFDIFILSVAMRVHKIFQVVATVPILVELIFFMDIFLRLYQDLSGPKIVHR